MNDMSGTNLSSRDSSFQVLHAEGDLVREADNVLRRRWPERVRSLRRPRLAHTAEGSKVGPEKNLILSCTVG